MKKTKRLWALLLVMVMALGLIPTAFAAPTIDSGRKASLSLYKYDITAASADGAWDAASYVSTGVQDDAVTDKLAKYAIQGVEFSYLRVASIWKLCWTSFAIGFQNGSMSVSAVRSMPRMPQTVRRKKPPALMRPTM